MATDSLLTLASPTTAIASTNGTGVPLLTTPGTPRRGLTARIVVSSMTAATPGMSGYFAVQQSPDNTNWYYVGQSLNYTPTTATVGNGALINIPFVMSFGSYVRLQFVASATTGLPSFVYSSALDPSWP